MRSLSPVFLFFSVLFACNSGIKNNSNPTVNSHSKLNDSLAAVLKIVLEQDQMYRSDTSHEHLLLQMDYDRENLNKVIRILNKYGWPGPEIVGENGNIALFLVIQHADIRTQRKYLPVVRKAVINHKLDGKSWILLEDRVSLADRGMQIYGSQVVSHQYGIWDVEPIMDEKNVNKRRQKLGLEKLEDYLKTFGIAYKLPDN
ncbi:MAG: hypothetical protein JWO09_2067 [Bacteroidetes bacterium]|nr:hypothetical protein [Bacteroidota bacterium]